MKKHKSKIPNEVLVEILKVYEFGKREHLELYPNDYIASTESLEPLKFPAYKQVIWTNWEEIFDIRDSTETLKAELDTEAA